MNRRRAIRRAGMLFLAACCLASFPAASRERWSEPQAKAWYGRQPWLVGANYIPANAINQLEMWQADTFDTATIERELTLAESIGMNTMRVFLHDLLWQQDAAGFRARIDQFLAIAARHHIRPLLVLFDSCWDPEPRLGAQHAPVPGIHNSGWVQSPAAHTLEDPHEYPRLRAYVEGVIGAFATDERILGWDLWNEPDNEGSTAYPNTDARDKNRLIAALLPQVYLWARAQNPSQPLTSGLWKGDWVAHDALSPFERLQIEQSDVLSLHNYGWPEDFEHSVRWLQRYHRPILCTEYMARSVGSTFDLILPLAKRLRVAAFNWGLVVGKTQTNFPWDSWQHPYVDHEPPVWHHDIFRADGTPYRAREVEIIRALTKASRQRP
ncbi:MAG TPA: hypothetical protein VK130_03725 [Steroidobacteraceae bacterium]|nr:hypothetical protein [Steroidobacteraceae bacterium]